MNGKYLKQLRMEKGLTQSELAEMLGYSDKSAVAQIERDHFELNQEKIKQYAEIFNVSVLDIMGFEPVTCSGMTTQHGSIMPMDYR